MKQLILAFQDLALALRHYRIWTQLAWVEIKQRYRRSVIGPWWISISMLIFILVMGEIFGRIFKEGLDEYIPFFTTGFLLWTFISASIIESTDLTRVNESFIKQIKMPFNLYLLKHLTRHTLFLAHNFVVYLLVMIYFHINPGLTALWAIPGFILFFINMYWICLLTTLLSARYRDVIPMITSCVQVAFFVTPISWMPKLLPPHSILMRLNPFVYFIGAIRNPLLGSTPNLNTWVYDIGTAIIGLTFTFLIFAYVRKRIPFWVD